MLQNLADAFGQDEDTLMNRDHCDLLVAWLGVSAAFAKTSTMWSALLVDAQLGDLGMLSTKLFLHAFAHGAGTVSSLDIDVDVHQAQHFGDIVLQEFESREGRIEVNGPNTVRAARVHIERIITFCATHLFSMPKTEDDKDTNATNKLGSPSTSLSPPHISLTPPALRQRRECSKTRSLNHRSLNATETDSNVEDSFDSDALEHESSIVDSSEIDGYDELEGAFANIDSCIADLCNIFPSVDELCNADAEDLKCMQQDASYTKSDARAQNNTSIASPKGSEVVDAGVIPESEESRLQVERILDRMLAHVAANIVAAQSLELYETHKEVDDVLRALLDAVESEQPSATSTESKPIEILNGAQKSSPESVSRNERSGSDEIYKIAPLRRDFYSTIPLTEEAFCCTRGIFGALQLVILLGILCIAAGCGAVVWCVADEIYKTLNTTALIILSPALYLIFLRIICDCCMVHKMDCFRTAYPRTFQVIWMDASSMVDS